MARRRTQTTTTQGLARHKAARNYLIELIRQTYDKIFSREYTRFYYHFNGKSTLVPRVAWTKPRFLYWRDLKAFKSEDVAALMIQNQWHAYKARQFMMNAVRAQYTVKTDPLTGRLMYTNVHTHKRGFKKPPLLGSEELDPEDMSLWGIYRLGVFFRRLGYGFIAPELRRFDVDGALLLSFEWQDYVDLGFTQSHVIKRVLLQIEKRAFFKSHRDLPVTLVRRDRLRYHHRVEKAAISIQRRYRVIYAALQRARAAERERVEKAKKKAEKDRKEGGLWWSGKIKNLPVPDHGKVYGNRTVETVHGWGSWIGERWVPLDDKTRPHKQRYKHNPLNVRFKFARTLHFKNDDAVQEQRAALVARLLEEDMRQRQAEAAAVAADRKARRA